MTKITARILRDARGIPSNIKVKGLSVDYEFYPSGAVSKVILSGRRASIPKLFEVLNMIYPRDVTVSIRGSAWYDRNPKSQLDNYQATSVAPHAGTRRIEYTCPAGKKAMLEFVHCYMNRRTAAGTAGLISIVWTLTPEGGAATGFINLVLRTNTVGDKNEFSVGATLTLFEGDVLVCDTSDLSTGGTVDYFAAYKLTEFDA